MSNHKGMSCEEYDDAIDRLTAENAELKKKISDSEEYDLRYPHHLNAAHAELKCMGEALRYCSVQPGMLHYLNNSQHVVASNAILKCPIAMSLIEK